MRKHSRSCVTASVCLASGFVFSHVATAATPLATDDTGVVDVGAWEVSLFGVGEFRDAGDSYELPVVEVETGVVDGVSVFVNAARAVDDPDDESSSSGIGNGEIGIKWQMFDKDGVTFAVGATYAHSLRQSSRSRGLVDDVNVLTLPAIVAYENGNWTFNAAVNYDLTSTSEDVVGYGFFTGYQAGDWWLLAEVFGEEVSGSDDSFTNAQVGFEYAMFDATTLLFSIGTALTEDLPDEDELDFQALLGLRWAFD